MEVKPQPKLKFLGVEIVHIQFKALERYTPGKKLRLDLKPKVFFPKEEPDTFAIIFDVKLDSEEIFYLEINSVGHFKLEDFNPAEHNRKALVDRNAPAIMFPYIRAFISTLTSNMGEVITPIVIPPQFFQGDLEEVKSEAFYKVEE